MEKRNLYLTNLPIAEAQTRFYASFQLRPKAESEQVDVTEALDRQTASPVFAKNNSPLWDSSAMDGVMVVSAYTQGATETTPLQLKLGEGYFPVNTGDPISGPFDAVIMAEDIQEMGEDMILIRQGAAPWQHVRPVGEDIVKGEMILPSSHTVRPVDIGVLLSGGVTRIAVKKKPAVAILPTGSELIEAGQMPEAGDIIESNSRMLEGLIRHDGGLPTRFPIVPDVYETIKEGLQTALLAHDVVLVCSGTSAGTRDYTVHVLEELGEVIVHGVAIKPGKPVILAVVKGKPVIGIPGYPVSAYLTYRNFVTPILNALVGVPQAKEDKVEATLTRRIVSSLKHREYVRVQVGRIGDKLVATPLPRGAGAAMSLVRADGFCIVEQDWEGIESGARVEVVLTRAREVLERTLVSIGSHDLILDIIADHLPKSYPGLRLSSSHVGSMGGLLALKQGETHIAPIHHLDDDTGTYNISIVKQLFPGEKMALIKGVGRSQGILVQKGNPLQIATLADLRRCRYINRQRGAGTRMLFDYKLKRAGIDPMEITGYEREAATHMAVAAAISNGSADAGLGIFSAASAMNLDFIPLDEEAYDFITRKAFLELDSVRTFIALLENQALQEEIRNLGGYDLGQCGEVCLIDC